MLTPAPHSRLAPPNDPSSSSSSRPQAVASSSQGKSSAFVQPTSHGNVSVKQSDGVQNGTVLFLDLHNLSKRQFMESDATAEDKWSRSSKRRKIDRASENRAAANSAMTPQLAFVLNPTPPTEAKPTGESLRDASLRRHQSSATCDSSNVHTSAAESQKRNPDKQRSRENRAKIVERLSRTSPDRAQPAAQLTTREYSLQKRVQGSASQPMPHPALQTLVTNKSRHHSPEIVNELSMQDDVQEIDLQRRHKLEVQFREQMAQGRRPGLVIPRLQCLDSQEEE
ncbi:hypothetical protein A0H81_11235 [Grifola frondosa]|uniref:Uncharacterized protein n=1 Tax=Grifola frondosa TaxID=5627 RepID=A0A1C7LYC8_GRIFR|nr:hypothetical protein A0H81_11235 [Grifola frondosa]